MFPGTALADQSKLIRFDNLTNSIQDVLTTSPEIRQRFIGEASEEAGKISDDMSKEIVDAAVREEKHLGKKGPQMLRDLYAAKTWQAKRDVAVKAMDGLDREMAIQSLQSGDMTKIGSLRWLGRRAPIYIGSLVADMMMARAPSPYLASMGGLAVGEAFIARFRQRMLDQLADNPELAGEMWDAANNFSKPEGFRKWARLSAMSAIDAQMARMTRATTGFDITQPSPGESSATPTPSGPHASAGGFSMPGLEGTAYAEEPPTIGTGPAVKALEASRAHAIALV